MNARPVEILRVDADHPVDVRLTTEQLASSKLRNRVARAKKDGADALAYLRREQGEYAQMLTCPDAPGHRFTWTGRAAHLDGHEFLNSR